MSIARKFHLAGPLLQKARLFVTRIVVWPIVLPLLILVTASALLNRWFNWGGFFLNLLAELLGILLTVVWIDQILDRREAERWVRTLERVRKRLELFANQSITSLRECLGFSATDIWSGASLTELKQPDYFIKAARDVMGPEIYNRVRALRTKSPQFAVAIERISINSDDLITKFGEKLEPREYDLLLDIHGSAEISLIYLRDSAGRALESHELEIIATNTKTMFDKIIELSRAVYPLPATLVL